MGIETLKYAELGLSDPVAIVGFPSVGLVSSIAANYYVAQLEMTPLAGLVGPEMPPYCLVTGGVAYPPVRMYGKPRRTKTGRDLVVCTSEYAPKPEDCFGVAAAVLGTLRDLGCRDVICLEGVPRSSETDAPVICGGSAETNKLIQSSGLQVMGSGMVKGVTGVMMYLSAARGMNVVSLLCPANPNLPDPGSAAAYVAPLAKMIRGLKVDPKILEEEGEEIKRRAATEQASVQRDRPESAIYG